MLESMEKLNLLDGEINISYMRLSKEDGDTETGGLEESQSISSQRKCIQQFIKSQLPDLGPFEEIVDDGYTGTNMNRPGMQRLLKLVEAGVVKTIIVRDLSRFSRDYLEAGHYLEFILPLYDVRFISINDRFDSMDYGESTGGLELAIRNLVNQMYSRDISRKIKSAVDLRKLSGAYVYGTAPYGYKKGEERCTIVVDDEAADVVRQIFSWAAEGVTITQIAKKLNDRGVTTPSVYLAKVRGKYPTRPIWSFESVRNILKNRIYTGDTVPFRSRVVRVGSDKVKQIPQELQQVIPETHEAIISREMFYKAQTTIKSTKKSKPKAEPNPLTSLLVCGCCGNRLSKGKSQNKNWLCASARYQTDSECSKVRIDDKKMKDILLRAILTQCRIADEQIHEISRLNQSAALEESALSKEQKRLKNRNEDCHVSTMGLYEEYVSGNLSKEEFIRKREEIGPKEEALKAQLGEMEKRIEMLKEKKRLGESQMEISSTLTQYQNISALTPELAKELVKQIIINPDGSIKIEWMFRLELPDRIDMDRINQARQHGTEMETEIMMPLVQENFSLKKVVVPY